MEDSEPSGGDVDRVGSAEMGMLGVDGSSGEDNVDFDNDGDVVAGIVGVVLEICDDVGVGFGVAGFSGVDLAGKFEVLTLVCFNVISCVEEGVDLGGWSGLPELERGGPAVSVPGMDLVDGTGGLRRSWVALFFLRVSGDGGLLAQTSFSPKRHKVHRHIVYRNTFFFTCTHFLHIFMCSYTIGNMLLTSKLYFIYHTNV